MASKAPPTGWEVTTGVWGTNIDRDETTTLSGQAAVKLEYDASTAAPTLLSPWVPVAGDAAGSSVGMVADIGTAAYIRFRTNSVTAGNTVTIKVYWYDKDRSLTATDTVWNAVASTANEWQTAGVARVNLGVRWARIEVTKANNNFSVFVDTAIVAKLPPSRYSTSDGSITQTIATGASWVQINGPFRNAGVPSDSTALAAEVGFDTSNGDILIYVPGIYVITASALYSDLQDGEWAALRFYWTYPSPAADLNYPGGIAHAATNNLDMTVQHTAVIYCDANTSVKVQTRHGGGGNRTIDAAQFGIVRIGN